MQVQISQWVQRKNQFGVKNIDFQFLVLNALIISQKVGKNFRAQSALLMLLLAIEENSLSDLQSLVATMPTKSKTDIFSNRWVITRVHHCVRDYPRRLKRMVRKVRNKALAYMQGKGEVNFARYVEARFSEFPHFWKQLYIGIKSCFSHRIRLRWNKTKL